MLLRFELLKLVVQLLNFFVDARNIEMVLGIIRLIQNLLGHGRNNSLDRHKEIVFATAPFSELILGEARVEGALRGERRILVRHLLLLSLEFFLSLLLLSQLLLALFVSLTSSAASAIVLVALVASLLFFLLLFTVDYWGVRPVTLATGASCSALPLAFFASSLSLLTHVLSVTTISCSDWSTQLVNSLISGGRGCGSLALRGASFGLLSVNHLLLALGVFLSFLAVGLTTASVLALAVLSGLLLRLLSVGVSGGCWRGRVHLLGHLGLLIFHRICFCLQILRCSSDEAEVDKRLTANRVNLNTG